MKRQTVNSEVVIVFVYSISFRVHRKKKSYGKTPWKQRNADKEETTAMWDMSYNKQSLENMNFVEMMSSHWKNEDMKV